LAIAPAIPPMMIHEIHPWFGSSNGINIPRSPCFAVSFNRPSVIMAQRALANLVPQLVEKQWRHRSARGLLLVVSY
jgi:hypothetical protein